MMDAAVSVCRVECFGGGVLQSQHVWALCLLVLALAGSNKQYWVKLWSNKTKTPETFVQESGTKAGAAKPLLKPSCPIHTALGHVFSLLQMREEGGHVHVEMEDTRRAASCKGAQRLKCDEGSGCSRGGLRKTEQGCGRVSGSTWGTVYQEVGAKIHIVSMLKSQCLGGRETIHFQTPDLLSPCRAYSESSSARSSLSLSSSETSLVSCKTPSLRATSPITCLLKPSFFFKSSTRAGPCSLINSQKLPTIRAASQCCMLRSAEHL